MYPNPCGPQQVVVTTPTVTVTKEPSWSWGTLVTSAISLFCCQCFGVPAMILAILSYVDHRVKQFESSNSKGSTALGLAIAAIVIGTIFWILFLIFYSQPNQVV